jgi:membrane protease YdiL (CAAX protease family)
METPGIQLADKPDSSPKLVAPLWHTAVILLWLLVPLSAWLPVRQAFPSRQHSDLPFFYLIQLEWQWIFFGILYLGLLFRNTGLKELIGTGWTAPRDFARDFVLGVAFSFLDVVLVVLLLLVFGAGHSEPDRLDPQRWPDLLGWFPIAVSAGFIEEVACRGYLQRQFHVLTGNPVAALVLQAAVFCLAHGYHLSAGNMVAKFLFGICIGLLALWRKSLLPGILGHAWQDCLVGVVPILLAR